MRAALLAATAAAFFAIAPAATASSGSSPWARYVAPVTACPGSAQMWAPADAQVQSMVCLINWTRRRVGLRTLHWSFVLADAAGSKADVIASCRDFSHYACGTRWPASATRQHRYSIWGENLYYGSRSVASPRAAMLAWLESPEHRAVLFGRPWRDLGLTVHGASGIAGDPHVSIWVLEVAGRR
jgi:uncharacterized protein YkwD